MTNTNTTITKNETHFMLSGRSGFFALTRSMTPRVRLEAHAIGFFEQNGEDADTAMKAVAALFAEDLQPRNGILVGETRRITYCGRDYVAVVAGAYRVREDRRLGEAVLLAKLTWSTKAGAPRSGEFVLSWREESTRQALREIGERGHKVRWPLRTKLSGARRAYAGGTA